MTYQIQYQTEQGDWVTDRSPLRTYKTMAAAKKAVDFMVDKNGVRICRTGSNIPGLHHDLVVPKAERFHGERCVCFECHPEHPVKY